MASLRRLALGNIVPSKTVFFCCDMQERFRLAIQHFKDIVVCADRLVRADLESHHFIALKSLVFAIIYSGNLDGVFLAWASDSQEIQSLKMYLRILSGTVFIY